MHLASTLVFGAALVGAIEIEKTTQLDLHNIGLDLHELGQNLRSHRSSRSGRSANGFRTSTTCLAKCHGVDEYCDVTAGQCALCADLCGKSSTQHHCRQQCSLFLIVKASSTPTALTPSPVPTPTVATTEQPDEWTTQLSVSDNSVNTSAITVAVILTVIGVVVVVAILLHKRSKSKKRRSCGPKRCNSCSSRRTKGFEHQDEQDAGVHDPAKITLLDEASASASAVTKKKRQRFCCRPACQIALTFCNCADSKNTQTVTDQLDVIRMTTPQTVQNGHCSSAMNAPVCENVNQPSPNQLDTTSLSTSPNGTATADDESQPTYLGFRPHCDVTPDQSPQDSVLANDAGIRSVRPQQLDDQVATLPSYQQQNCNQIDAVQVQDQTNDTLAKQVIPQGPGR